MHKERSLYCELLIFKNLKKNQVFVHILPNYSKYLIIEDQPYYREKRREVGMAERPREEGGRDGRASQGGGRKGWHSVQGRREVGIVERKREKGGRDGIAFKGGGR